MGQCQRNGDLPGFYQHGMEFLHSLYSYANNRYLTDALNDLFPLTQRCLYAIMRAGQAQISHTHHFLESLLKTIIERDQEQLHTMVTEFGHSYSKLAQTSAEALSGRTSR